FPKDGPLPFFSYCLEILATKHRSQTAKELRRVKITDLRIGGGVYQRQAIAERSFRTLSDTRAANICAILQSAIGCGAA
ncbi:MAG: hypothetical protein WBL40_13665, partial [Terrimicrobiaceae bacterium]